MSEGPLHKAVGIAADVLDGKIDILNGCSLLTRQLHAAGLDRDPDFLIFVGVESESDHLPYRTGDRRNWNAEALILKDKEIADLTAGYSEEVRSACRQLVERFGQSPGNSDLDRSTPA